MVRTLAPQHTGKALGTQRPHARLGSEREPQSKLSFRRKRAGPGDAIVMAGTSSVKHTRLAQGGKLDLPLALFKF